MYRIQNIFKVRVLKIDEDDEPYDECFLHLWAASLYLYGEGFHGGLWSLHIILQTIWSKAASSAINKWVQTRIKSTSAFKKQNFSKCYRLGFK